MAKSQKLKGTQLQDFEKFGKKQRVTSLEIIDVTVGTGSVVTQESSLRAHYTGALCETGSIFESSYDKARPLDFTLDEVIKGWQEGLVGMREGGVRRLLIPSEMAYGRRRASATIPPNSDLVFDIELIESK
jgi:FKBP-type peptidyl-prolyl cis-trans isomerase